MGRAPKGAVGSFLEERDVIVPCCILEEMILHQEVPDLPFDVGSEKMDLPFNKLP